MKAVWEARVVDPIHSGMAAQEFGHGFGVFRVALDPQRDRLNSLKEQEGAEWRQHGPGDPLVNTATAPHVGGLAEVLRVDHAMVRRIWLVENGESGGMLRPGEVATVHDGSAQRGAVPAEKLG